MHFLLAFVGLVTWGTLAFADVSSAAPAPSLVEVRKIWDRAPHNAFTDLTRFQGRWFCVFREGKAHVSPDGALRIITSADARQWQSAALIQSGSADLRDAKITITPDGRLMLSGAGALHQPADHRHQSMTWFSADGKKWSDAYPVGEPDFWLWRTTWHDGKAYGIGYATNSENRVVRLYRSEDGVAFETLVSNLFCQGYPNETSLLFRDDGTCYCLLRRDGGDAQAFLGVSQPPYTPPHWKWKGLGVRIGGPHMIALPDGRIVAAVRLYDGGTRTSLCWIDPDAATLTEFLKLPSGGDTSYAGLVWHANHLWVSYYSSHEAASSQAKTAIYLAQVAVPLRPE